MQAHGAVVGGEGNGGVILPAAHYGRDGLVAAALVAQAVTGAECTLRALADRLPRYAMIKSKLDRADEPWERPATRLRSSFSEFSVDETDGLRFGRGEEWVHVRASGTEPVVRVIAESPDVVRTRALIDRADRALRAAR
jgi:phosphomannomutase